MKKEKHTNKTTQIQIQNIFCSNNPITAIQFNNLQSKPKIVYIYMIEPGAWPQVIILLNEGGPEIQNARMTYCKDFELFSYDTIMDLTNKRKKEKMF